MNANRPGFILPLKIRDVPLFVHWSIPLGGLAIWAISGFDIRTVVYCCVSYFVVITLHELGHFAMARIVGAKVLFIEVTGVGGKCQLHPPRRILHRALIYSAGILAQLALFIATGLYIVLLGWPQSRGMQSACTAFTLYNILIVVFNLIPTTSSRGVKSDGRLLWDLAVQAYKNCRGHTPVDEPAQQDKGILFAPHTSLLSLDGFVPTGFNTGIEILNDSTTPMELVFTVLQHHLGLERDQAIFMMISIHNKGGLLIPLSTFKEAEEIADKISADAKQQGFSLICRAVAVSPYQTP